MNNLLFNDWVRSARETQDDFVVALIQTIITHASNDSVSDLHFQPDKTGIEIWYRFDGVLHELGHVEAEHAAHMVARLKVLADLLTYRTNLPQEGRVQAGRVPGVSKEMRVSTMPTLFGERVVIRFFAEEEKYQYPDQLGLPSQLEQELLQTINRSGGAIILCGPAGSGKTTTAYSLLRHLALRGDELRSIITLEDPVEHPIPRTAQIEVDSRNELTLPDMIKYTMRQDPEVLFIGEIRDQETALAAFQAALTGHLLLTTFHAGSAVEAIGRLSEMNIEPFILRSSINTVLCQRLLRRLCHCAKESTEQIEITLQGQSYQFDSYRMPVGCEACSFSGYRDRIIVTELIPWRNPQLTRAVLDRRDTDTLQYLATEAGMVTIAENAVNLVRLGTTSPVELQRVLGAKTKR